MVAKPDSMIRLGTYKLLHWISCVYILKIFFPHSKVDLQSECLSLLILITFPRTEVYENTGRKGLCPEVQETRGALPSTHSCGECRVSSGDHTLAISHALPVQLACLLPWGLQTNRTVLLLNGWVIQLFLNVFTQAHNTASPSLYPGDPQ